jgi:hypothetical protein
MAMSVSCGPYDATNQTAILARMMPDLGQEQLFTATPEKAEELCKLPNYRVATQEEYDKYLGWNANLYPHLKG